MGLKRGYDEAEKKIEEARKKKAKNLDLRGLSLTKLPESIGHLVNLTKLDLGYDPLFPEKNNRLSVLPESLGQLTQLTELNLSANKLTTLPDSLGKLTQLQTLDISNNKLTTLPDSLGKLTQLQTLDISNNQLTTLPDVLGQLTQLTELNLSYNQLTTLPEWLGQLTQLTELNLSSNRLTALPDSLGQLTQLETLTIYDNLLTLLPDSLGQLARLHYLNCHSNKLKTLPHSIKNLVNLKNLLLIGNPIEYLPPGVGFLSNLIFLDLRDTELRTLPPEIGELNSLRELILGEGPTESGGFAPANLGKLISLPKEFWQLQSLECLVLGKNQQIRETLMKLGSLMNIKVLGLSNMGLVSCPDSLNKLTQLEKLDLSNNQLTDLPSSLAQLEHLTTLELKGNPLNPAMQSAYDQGLDAVKAYLRSLEQNAEPLYEAKLVLVGEGNVGKTTLLKALKGNKDEAPQKNEPTTHGVEIDIHGLRLPHPAKDGVEIQLNAWDFGGQDVYRVTHQFFFSRRSLYLLVWEPRNNVQQGRLDEWLDMIRLRVGDEARVIIVSTHSQSGGHLARIDKPVFKQQYGDMIVGFHEVDSLVPDTSTGEMFGIAELKKVIAEQASHLEQMGMLFNNNWKAARDELIAHAEPRVSYTAFAETCARHGLSEIDAETLAHLMHDLGYIVHYSDDEKLRDDVVLKPQWLTKAIGFVLEDRVTQEAEGILPDGRLSQVWHDHPFKDEPRYEPNLYPFFLRLMEKYDVSYRLPDGKASLVAQHVPQVRPELPWLPEGAPPENLRRIAMICAMEEDPPGLVPWMIVRTHDYAYPVSQHSLHWQKGMFLRHGTHGEAMLEQRGREFHIYAQADWPQYFMTIIQHTLEKIIKDNWPGMEGRYSFTIPCPGQKDEKPCTGRFRVKALQEFLAKGAGVFPCQECFGLYSISELLMGFEERDMSVQLREIKEQLTQAREQIAGLDSRVANYFMAMMRAIADEAKNGPRLFTFRSGNTKLPWKQLISRPMELQLWCEHESHPHPVLDSGKGVYQIDQPYEWVIKIAPYANIALDILKTVAPIAAPAINSLKGPKTTETLKIADYLELAKEISDKLPAEIKTPDRALYPGKLISDQERSGILALHRLLNELDPTQDKLGLHRVATYTGDYRWLCKHHYDAWQPNIPDVIQS